MPEFLWSQICSRLLGFSQPNNAAELTQSIVYGFSLAFLLLLMPMPLLFVCVYVCEYVCSCLNPTNFHPQYSIKRNSPYYYPFIAMIRFNFCCYYYNDNKSEYNLLQTMFISPTSFPYGSVWSTPYFLPSHCPPGLFLPFRFLLRMCVCVYFSAWPNRKWRSKSQNTTQPMM